MCLNHHHSTDRSSEIGPLSVCVYLHIMNFCHVLHLMSTCPFPRSVAYASEMCDVLNQDLFSACHEYLSPTSFHQQCRSDTCKCGTPCFCSALAHYAHHCRRFSVVIDFRSQITHCGEFSAKSQSILSSRIYVYLRTTNLEKCL